MKRAMLLAGAFALALSACAGSRGEVTDLTQRPAGTETHAEEPETAQLHDEGEDPETPPAQEESGVVEVIMSEFAFTPSTFTFEVGETVTFLFHNEGAVAHDALIGDESEQEHHEAEMAGGGAAHHEDLTAVDLEPGKTGTIEYTFAEPGELLIGCHYAGHWDAGMRASIVVKE